MSMLEAFERKNNSNSFGGEEKLIFEKVFPGELIEAIKKIVHPMSDYSDNNTKAKIIHNLCKKVNLKPSGTGTNRTTVYHPSIPEMIFKIGLDEKGCQNNIDEFNLYGDDFLQQYTVKTKECYESTDWDDGLIATSEKVRVMTQNDYAHFHHKIIRILEDITTRYIVDDVGPKEFLNWGLNNRGIPVILDYAEFVSMENHYFSCFECDGDLQYFDDFSGLYCLNCDAEYTIAEIKNDTKDLNDDSNQLNIKPSKYSDVGNNNGGNFGNPFMR